MTNPKMIIRFFDKKRKHFPFDGPPSEAPVWCLKNLNTYQPGIICLLIWIIFEKTWRFLIMSVSRMISGKQVMDLKGEQVNSPSMGASNNFFVVEGIVKDLHSILLSFLKHAYVNMFLLFYRSRRDDTGTGRPIKVLKIQRFSFSRYIIEAPLWNTGTWAHLLRIYSNNIY